MANQETKKIRVPFLIDLQRFSDTAPAEGHPHPQTQPSQADLTARAMAILQNGGTAPAGEAPQGQPQPTGDNSPQNSPQQVDNNGQTEGQQPNQEPTQGQPQQQQAPNMQGELLVGKFKTPQELANGYVNVEKAYTQTRQELAAKDQQMQAMAQAMEQMKQQMASVINPQQQQQQPSPEELNEQFMNQFYENPTQSIQQMVQQAIEQSIMPQIAPIQQQFKEQQMANARNVATKQFADATPDFDQFKPAMAQILSSNQALNQMDPRDAIQIAYKMAKGESYKDPNAIFQDTNYVLQNMPPEAKNQVIQEYLQGLKQGNQAPTVITGQAGQANGQAPGVPENKPQNNEEARAMALKMLQG